MKYWFVWIAAAAIIFPLGGINPFPHMENSVMLSRSAPLGGGRYREEQAMTSLGLHKKIEREAYSRCRAATDPGENRSFGHNSHAGCLCTAKRLGKSLPSKATFYAGRQISEMLTKQPYVGVTPFELYDISEALPADSSTVKSERFMNDVKMKLHRAFKYCRKNA